MAASLFDHILFQARLRPGATAVFDRVGPIAFHALVRDVEALATNLLERGFGRDDMVALDLGFSYRHLLLILALDRLGIPSLSLPASDAWPLEMRARFGATAVISGGGAPADAPGGRWITIDEHTRPASTQPDLERLAKIETRDDALVRVIWSSGTTGGVKGAPISRAVQAHRLSARRLARGLGARTRYFTAAPLSSSPGYIMALATLAAGGSVVLPDPAVGFISQANALGVTAASASPVMLAELLGRAPSHGLETIEMLMVSGGPLTSQLVRQARLVLTPNLWTGYGTTETDGVAQLDTAVALDDPSAVGFVFPWVHVEIVDPADRPLPPGREGLLRVRSAQTIASYHGDNDATRRNFRAGWFYPGDLGTISRQGLLRVTGRIEDIIVRGDLSLSPLPIEEVIRGVPGVRDVAVFPLPSAEGRQAICAALVLEPGIAAQAVQSAAAATLGDRVPTRLFIVEQLPRSPNGKVLRRILVEWAQRALAP